MGGVRRIDGVSLIWAFLRKAGTCRSDVKEEIQIAESIRMRVPIRETGADWLVVVMKFL